MADKVYFQIVEMRDMSKQGKKIMNDPRMLPFTFHAITIPELKDGIPASWVNSKEKLAEYVYNNCGEGIFDIRIYMKGKTRTKKKSCTAIRMTLADDGRDGFIIERWDTQGKKNKFGRRYGIFKRIVGWGDEY